MTTMIRLGTGIEAGLRDFHRETRSANAPPLTPSKRGIFLRLVEPTELASLLMRDCGYDLHNNPRLTDVRELMVHRHLYTHRAGEPDDKYVADVLEVTGTDILPDLQAGGYPDQDIYWFRPLTQLPRFIEAAREFIANLP